MPKQTTTLFGSIAHYLLRFAWRKPVQQGKFNRSLKLKKFKPKVNGCFCFLQWYFYNYKISSQEISYLNKLKKMGARVAFLRTGGRHPRPSGDASQCQKNVLPPSFHLPIGMSLVVIQPFFSLLLSFLSKKLQLSLLGC